MNSQLLAAATGLFHPLTPALKDLARHPSTSHTLNDLAYILAESLRVTSAYICDWNPQTGIVTILAEYLSPHANQAEQQSDLNQSYDMRQNSSDNGLWLDNGEVVIEHLHGESYRLNSHQHMTAFGGQSVLAVPLIINQRVVGFAELWESRERRDFTASDVQLCRTLIQQVELALENVSLLESQQQQLHLSQTLQEMGALLTTDFTLEQVYEHIFRLLERVIEYDGASIQLLDENGGLVPVAAAGMLTTEEILRLAPKVPAEVIQQRWGTHSAAAIPDTHNDPSWVRLPETSSIRSWVGAALNLKDRFIGLLDLVSLRQNSYDQAAADLLLVFANQAAIAIENVRLFAATRRQAQELSGLYETALVTGGIMDIHTLLARVFQQIYRLLKPDGFFVALYDEVPDELLFYEYREAGLLLKEIEESRRFPVEGLTGWIVRHRQPLFVRDLWYEHLPTEPIVNGQHSRSWLGVPLLVRERILGVISIQSFYPNAFTEADQRFMESLANQVAVAIENVRLFEAEARRRQEAELLGRMTAALTGSLELDDFLQQAVNLVAQQLPGVHNVTVTILEGDKQSMRPRVRWTMTPEYTLNPIGARILLADTYASQQAIQTCTLVLIEDLHQIPGQNASYLQMNLTAGLRSILYVPIVVHGQSVGILHVNVWHQVRQFRGEEIAFCQGMAYQIAVAYEITRLFAAERHQLHLARTLQQVGSLLTTRLSLDELYTQLFKLLQKVVDFDAAAIFLLNEAGQMNRAACFSHTGSLNQSGESIPFSRQLQTLWRDRPFVVTAELESYPTWRDMAPQEMQAWIGAALLVQGEFIGTLNVYSREKNAYSQTDGEVVASFANQAAIAILNTRLHEEIKQGANELTVLYQVAQLIVSIIDIDELLRRTTEFIAERLYPHVFGFLLLDEENQNLWLHPSYYGTPARSRQVPWSITEGVIGQVARTGQWHIVEDVELDPYYIQELPTTQSELVVPLKVSGKIIGVINAESETKNFFTTRDVRFLITLAGQVAAAIERIQIHQHLADLVAERTGELQEEQNRLTTILDGAGEGIFFTDAEGTILYVNRAALQLTGLQSQQVLGQYLLGIPHLKLAPGVQESLRQAIRQGKHWSGELALRTQDERTLDIRLTLSPLYNTDYSLTGFVGIESDISRLKEVERLKSEFISNVSHELRTPLTNILTSTTLLERGKPEKRAHYLQVLRAESNRLTRLINSLLDLSWLETSSGTLYLQTVDLGPLLRTIMEGFHYLAQSRRIMLSYSAPPLLPPVMADASQLAVALRNLLENAFAYTLVEGTITVVLDIPPPSTQMRVRICDDGVGIPSDELPRVLERFFRGRASLTLGIPGTGLGLAVTRYIIEQHNGWMEITSQEEVGTTVAIWLPLAEQNPERTPL
ncbi:MAG: GAF domain-containing protein [Chloroflexi bacterium]|nr:GAF domain-containing protein [Chloroflexota bacterium]MBP8056497.1 GAF domain-containing protein [Chloroflexota bacterium]